MPRAISIEDPIKPYWSTTDGRTVQLYHGNVTDVLARLPAKSVHMCVTSPPYWGLRDYGTATWEGGDPECKHKMEKVGTVQYLDRTGKPGSNNTRWQGAKGHATVQLGETCTLCGAIRVEDSQLGSEPSPDCKTDGQAQCSRCHVCNIVAVFREVYRVLRDDGTIWVNYGDSYNANVGTGFNTWEERGSVNTSRLDTAKEQLKTPIKSGLKAGNLVGIPWRVALALQADGWVLRQDIIWHKPAPMPECLAPETRVFIRVNGWVSRTTLARVYAMKDKPEVLGPNGWVKILNIWKTLKPAMTIEVGKVERVICSPDHKFPVSHDNDNLSVEDKPAADIRATGYRDYLLYHPVGRHLVPTLTEWEGVGLTGHLGYVLGLYAAEGSQDGGHRMKWTIHVKEDYIKNKFNKSLQTMGLRGQSFPDPNSNAQNLVTTSEWLQRTVQTFVLGRDARTKRLNVELLLNSPKDFRQRLLEGYIDGDGSDRGDGWGASSASRDLRDDLSTLASSLGIITSKGYSKSHLPGRDKEYHSHSLWTPYINRSTKKGTEGTYQILPRGRKNLDGEREMIDMEVEGGLFLIGDGLVTHNSVRNRCTKAHEYVFLLTKSAKYFYDAEAIREPLKMSDEDYRKMLSNKSKSTHQRVGTSQDGGAGRKEDGPNAYYEDNATKLYVPSGSNKRSVWTISSQGYEGAHFATFPPKLIEPMIKAGTSEKGCCAKCGSPWKRVVEEKTLTRERPNDYVKRTGEEGTGSSCANSVAGVDTKTVGWEPTCKCEADVVPCTVLDCFIGSGTTCAVSLTLGRRSVGIDLSERYLKNNAVPRIEGRLLSLGRSSLLKRKTVDISKFKKAN